VWTTTKSVSLLTFEVKWHAMVVEGAKD
jgi:hypothetical protein